MSSKIDRQAFEDWAEINLGLPLRRLSTGDYQSFGMSMAWKALIGFAAPPELAELQAKIDRLNSELTTARQKITAMNNDFDVWGVDMQALRTEIERLKSESFEALYNDAIDEIERLKGEPTDTENLPILGYLPGGKRIHPIKSGMIATACVVSCVGCHKVIRGMGGPMRGALCPDCWEAAGL